jgi:hypothetical protein
MNAVFHTCSVELAQVTCSLYVLMIFYVCGNPAAGTTQFDERFSLYVWGRLYINQSV